MIDENNFLKALIRHNEDALDFVIENYGYVIKSVIKKHLRLMPSAHDEVFNDVLLAIWQNAQSFRPERSSFKNWVAGIARFKSIDALRKNLRLREEFLDESISNGAFDSEILKLEIDEQIEMILSSLSDEDREIFKSYYLRDMNPDEISKEMGLNKPTIYNRLSRSRKKLKNIYGGRDEIEKYL